MHYVGRLKKNLYINLVDVQPSNQTNINKDIGDYQYNIQTQTYTHDRNDTIIPENPSQITIPSFF